MVELLEQEHLPWGRWPREPQRVAWARSAEEAAVLVPEIKERAGSLLGVGLRRSYGVSCMNGAGALLDMSRCARFRSFDPKSGLLLADAGLSLDRLLATFVPKGFFLPVAPGTRFVTLGGAVANDVHGKNQETAGTFGRHVTRIELLRSNGERLFCSPQENEALFAATVGGLGLTGLILSVELRLKPIKSAYFDQELKAFETLEDYFALMADAPADKPYSVAWLDCLSARQGRGILTFGGHAEEGGLKPHPEKPKRRLAFDLPGFCLNRASVSAFNHLYFHLHKRKEGRSHPHYAPFLHPLDAIADWNRLYGSRGFFQYQCVLPPDSAEPGIAEMLKEIRRSGQGSFLAVLKTFGEMASPGLLSFPMKGTTLALDFANRGEETRALMQRLDAILLEGGGRLYPAKDGRMPATVFQRGYPNWERFVKQIDPAFSSDFWRRVCQEAGA